MIIRCIEVSQTTPQPSNVVRQISTPTSISYNIIQQPGNLQPSVQLKLELMPTSQEGVLNEIYEESMLTLESMRGKSDTKLFNYLNKQFPSSGQDLNQYTETFRTLLNVVLWLQPGYLVDETPNSVYARLEDQFIIDYNGNAGSQKDVYFIKRKDDQGLLKELFHEGLVGRLKISFAEEDVAIDPVVLFYLPFDKGRIESIVSKTRVDTALTEMITGMPVDLSRKNRLNTILQARDQRIRRFITERF